eukprot:GHVS01059857.1.p1 GENE.GHVS01059857.1~~GHVS01059857.1.p1  ORF type:complete len:714 (+),score=145.59 GHVS01059857.1:79-2220(+)
MLSSLEVDLAVAIVQDTFGPLPALVCHTLLLKGSVSLQELQSFLKESPPPGDQTLYGASQQLTFDTLATSLLVLIQHNLVVASVPSLGEQPNTALSSSIASLRPLSADKPTAPPLSNAQQVSYRLASAGVCGQVRYEASQSALASRLRVPRYALLAEGLAGRNARALLCQVAKLGRTSMKTAIEAATNEYYQNSYALLLDPSDFIMFSDGSSRPPPPTSAEDLERCFVRLVADNFLVRCTPVLPNTPAPPPPEQPPPAATTLTNEVREMGGEAKEEVPKKRKIEEVGKGEFDLFASDSDNPSSPPVEAAAPPVGRGTSRGRGKRKAAGRGRGEGRGGKVMKRSVEEMSPPPPPQALAGGDDLNSLSRDLMQIIHDTTGSYSASDVLACSGASGGDPAGGRSKRAVEKEKMRAVMQLYQREDCVFKLNCQHLNLLLSKQMAEDFVAARFVDSPVVRFAIRCLLNKVRHQSTVRTSGWTVYAGRMSFSEIEHEVAQMAAAQGKRPPERNTLLKVLDAMTRHRDRMIITETEGANSMYFIDWNTLKILLKGRVIYDSVSARCGEAASRVWSVIAQPNQATGAESLAWDDKSVAATALMSPNKARESLYRLAVEGFARIQESDVTSLPNSLSTRHAAVFSIHQPEVRCHVLRLFFRTALNLYYRKRRECAQINQLDWRLQSLSASEEKKLLALQSGEDLLEAELLNLDRLIMILRDL